MIKCSAVVNQNNEWAKFFFIPQQFNLILNDQKANDYGKHRIIFFNLVLLL